MYILGQNGDGIVKLNEISIRNDVFVTEDGAGFSESGVALGEGPYYITQPSRSKRYLTILGTYPDKKRAQAEVADIWAALERGLKVYRMEPCR